MITVSKEAQEQVRAYFDGKELQPVRIFLNSGGCGGPSLAMAVDQPTEKDSVFTFDGIDFVMEKELLEKAKPVSVNYSGIGFQLDSKLELGNGGCGSCGGSCSSE